MNDKPTSPSDGGSPTGSDSSDSSASFPSSNTQGADGAQRDSRQGAQHGPQPGPAPSFQQYGGPQPGPQGGSTHRFFDSLRGSGLMRTNERWIAGVAGGVAHRFDLDPTLVRCVWVVLSLFAGVGLVLYGLAWALLPEESDGRIHLEEALSGRFNAGLAGAIGMTIIGMSTFGSGFIPSWYVHEAGTAGIAAALWPLFWLGLIVLAIVFLIRSAQNRSANRKAARGPRGPQPWQTYPAGTAQAPGSRPGVQAGGFASAWDSSAPGSGTPAFNQSAGGQSWQSRSYRQRPPYQPVPMPVRPARPRRPGPGSSLSLAVLGLGLLTAAGVWYATVTHHLGLLQGQFILIGILVALLGAGIVVSGLRRRHGGWMTVLGWPVLFVVAIPALATASIVPTSLARMPFETLKNSTTAASSTVTWQELTASASGGSVTRSKDIGDLTLDLRGMPAEEAGKLSTITAHLDVGTLRIKTDTDQPVEVRADVDMGAIDSQVSRAWTVDGRQMNQDDEGPRTYDAIGKTIPAYSSSSGGLNTKRTLASPNSDDQRPQITINASVDTGTINIEERSNTVSWYGNVEEPVWIVSMWFDEKGEAHGDDMPVPGMNHQAITAKDAETCIRTAHESVDADDRSEDVGWSNLSDLTSAERTSYDSCVQRTLSGQGAAQPSASPSPSGAATPTPSPTPTKQSATASPTAG
ncbi:PspC domain-containing protein [Actinomyces oris]|uniref:PspC domain-containing protein n=1 Tax=Actinomyces oris TaxID=544580 RepID=A0A508BME4_9ACTO|nr:PspC domain-containing protein [Actinomyces oris]QQC38834.1 PspC domain-containing protein [Actinomyces oris]TQD59312.1 PspC domain-containing protein [Actinomyces oris]